MQFPFQTGTTFFMPRDDLSLFSLSRCTRDSATRWYSENENKKSLCHLSGRRTPYLAPLGFHPPHFCLAKPQQHPHLHCQACLHPSAKTASFFQMGQCLVHLRIPAGKQADEATCLQGLAARRRRWLQLCCDPGSASQEKATQNRSVQPQWCPSTAPHM